MSGILVKTLKRTAFGFTLGMAVGNLIAAFTGHPAIVSPLLLERVGSLRWALLAQTVLSGFIGAAGFGGVSLYDMERWPLLLTTLVHYVIYLVVFIPSALSLGWTETAAEIAFLAAVMASVHLVIFLVMCARYRAQVRELNELNEKTRRLWQQIGGVL